MRRRVIYVLAAPTYSVSVVGARGIYLIFFCYFSFFSTVSEFLPALHSLFQNGTRRRGREEKKKDDEWIKNPSARGLVGNHSCPRKTCIFLFFFFISFWRSVLSSLHYLPMEFRFALKTPLAHYIHIHIPCATAVPRACISNYPVCNDTQPSFFFTLFLSLSLSL